MKLRGFTVVEVVVAVAIVTLLAAIVIPRPVGSTAAYNR